MLRRAFFLGAVVGLLSACSALPTRPLERPAPFSVTGQASVTEIDYSFNTRDGLTLVAKLTLPATSPQRAPVAIFLGGSGTWDADYSQLNDKNQLVTQLPTATLAQQSAQSGIAFIRYQKRGSTSPGGLANEQWRTAQLDNLLDDFRILLAKAKADPRLDGSRIALVGHSEGTMISTWVSGSDPDVKAFVLLGLVRRNLKEVYRFQMVTRNGETFFALVDSQPKDGCLSLSEIDAASASVRFDNWQAFDANRDSRLSKEEYLALLNGYYDEWIRNIEQAKPELLVPGNGSPAGWFQQHFRRATVGDAWQRIRTPVLVINGKSDLNTPVWSESQPFEAMLSARGHPDHRLIEPEGLDHLFKDQDGVSHANKVFEAIVPWLKERLKVH